MSAKVGGWIFAIYLWKFKILITNVRTDSAEGFELAAMERRHIARVLEYTKGNKTETARLLKIGLTTLYRKIEEYKI